MSDPPKCISEVIRRAKKEHKCCECGITIRKREEYSYTSGIWDNGPLDFKQCMNCHDIFQAAIRASDNDGYPCYEDLKEWFLGNMCSNYNGKEFLDGMADRIKIDADKLNLLLRVDTELSRVIIESNNETGKKSERESS